MDVVVIEFDGEIEDFPMLVQTVDNLIAGGTRHLVLDLQPLQFINSAALGYLIRAQQRMEGEGGELALTRLSPALVKILEMTDLDVIFPAFETIEEAVDFLGAAASPDGAPDKEVRRQDWR